MGKLVDGEWKPDWYDTKSTGGKFVRKPTAFHNWVTPDGAPGPTGEGGFRAESGRYHLYVSYACPWAHRTLIFLALKGLTEHISVDAVHQYMGDDGWTFETEGAPGATGDTLFGEKFLRDIYVRNDPKANGRVTVPILWDKQTNQIVCNESSEIIRMLNSAFDGLTGDTQDFWPENLREEIEEVNARIYSNVNNGVYKSGFATSQTAYEEAVSALFETLDWLEDRLATRRYLMGDRITEADWRLFTTLVRFDPVYVGHFKCNIRRLVDYPNLWAYTRELYQWPGVAETVNMVHIKDHYYGSHGTINPTGVVPVGPAIDFTEPHGRERLAAA